MGPLSARVTAITTQHVCHIRAAAMAPGEGSHKERRRQRAMARSCLPAAAGLTTGAHLMEEGMGFTQLVGWPVQARLQEGCMSRVNRQDKPGRDRVDNMQGIGERSSLGSHEPKALTGKVHRRINTTPRTPTPTASATPGGPLCPHRQWEKQRPDLVTWSIPCRSSALAVACLLQN